MAFARRPDRARVAQESDAPVSVRREVAHRLSSSDPVVGRHVVGVQQLDQAVDDDHRPPLAPLLRQQPVVVATGGHHDEAVHPVTGEGPVSPDGVPA
jgi:hypothetical protein